MAEQTQRTAGGPRRLALGAARAALLDAGPAAAVAMAGYVGVLTVSAFAARRRGAHRTALPAEPVTRFVVVIPAHDEERLIGSALRSLAALDYPKDLVRVHVVADNCTDGTVAVVEAHGARAHDRRAPDDPGKGPALRWLLERLWEEGEPHDAVLVMDADTTVSANLLRVADARLRAGDRVVQVHYAVRDAGATTATAFRAAALAGRHYLRPLGRTHLGGTTGLFGNGMVFAADVLRQRTFSNHLTEDIEYGLQLLLEGTRVGFAADASVEAEMPTTLEASRTQHERWERGRVEMARTFVPRLVSRAVRGGPAGRVAYADAAADQLLPPFSLVVVATAAGAAVSAAVALVAPSPRARRRLALTLAAAAVQAVHVLASLRMVDAPPAVYRALASAPRLVLWKLGLWGRVVRGPGDVAWVRTARNDDAAPEAAGRNPDDQRPPGPGGDRYIDQVASTPKSDDSSP